jgi:PAS domain S-box-containing protein
MLRDQPEKETPPGGAPAEPRREISVPVLWLIGSLILYGLIAVVSYESITAIHHTSEQVEQTHRGLADLDRVLLDLKDAETGQRGFLATQDERFLEPYYSALRSLPESMKKLESSLSEDTKQRDALVALNNNVRLRVRILGIPLELRRSGKSTHAEELEILTYGKYMMDDIRAQIGVMKGQEEALLARYRTAEFSDAERTKQLIIIGNVFAAALLLVSFSLLRGENLRRRAAEALARTHAAQAQDLYDNAPCGYHTCDENAIFLTINRTELQWLGYTREELVGKMCLLDLLTPRSRPQFIAGLDVLKERGWVNDIELELRRKDGSTFIASVNATASFDAEGKYLTSRSSLFDVTERHKARVEIEHLNAKLRAHAGDLETANRELESFSYTVSHDLRAPLRAINGFATILKEDYGSSLQGEGVRLLGVIRDSAKRMGGLIDDLLAFSRLGRAPLHRGAVDMRSLVREVVAEITQNEGLGKAALNIGPLPPAFGDRSLLRQVWSNLLQNGLKYSSTKETPNVTVEGEVRGGEIVYWVADNGVGFDMRFYDKLFGVFQRLHDETQNFPGTGVGLAIVHRIVERHGGRVWAEGEPDKGARFYFGLPRSQE